MTRPYTPDEQTGERSRRIYVKRCCENCGREIGDMTQEEGEAAMSGAPLPSVAEECGCPPILEQLARFMNRRDEHENGTAAWDQLDEVAHESYRKDARYAMQALAHLGWAQKGSLT
jgi:hypothetical protein